MALISIQQSLHFKIVHLIFKYFIYFVVGEFYRLYYYLHSSIFWQWQKGTVHKVRHAIFGQFFPPSPLSHFVTHLGTPNKKLRHTPRTPSPQFLVGVVQKTRTKAPCTNSRSIVRKGFCSGSFVRWSFVWKVLSGVVFIRSPFCQNTSVTTES